MNIAEQLAKHVREVFFGGNWTAVNLKQELSGVSWQQALTRLHDCNTIAILVYHIHYYIAVQIKVLQGGPLEGNDMLSFNHPPVNSQQEWEAMLEEVWSDAEKYAGLVEKLPSSVLSTAFTDSKYGNYYRNIAGLIEHTHYHLGQIVLIRKMIQQIEKK